MRNSTIMILYTGDDWHREEVSHTEAQKFGYGTWGEICIKLNVRLLRSSIKWFNGNKISKYWELINGQWQKKEESIIPTVCYDKSRNYEKETAKLLPEVIEQKLKIDRVIPIINTPEFSTLLDNKLNQAVIFHDYMPKTKLVPSGRVIKNEKKELMVIKKFHGSGGEQVTITDDQNIEVKDKVLLQEFISAKKDNVLKDIRIVFIGDEPQYALSRIAARDSYFTNFHQGASIEFLDLHDLESIISLSKKIIEPLNVFTKKTFSLDYLVSTTTGKPFLVEINTMPGLVVFDERSQGILEKYLVSLTNYLLH